MFGATAGQGVVWYTGQFYALFYLQNVLLLDKRQANIIVATALALGMPLFVVFGALSDRIGRKRIIMAGLPAGGADATCRSTRGWWRRRTTTWSPSRAATTPATGEIKLIPVSVGPDGTRVPSQARQQPATRRCSSCARLRAGVFVTMVYGPIAAYLVEAFPAKIRYTSLSLPYHIGNGVFGGLLPVIGLAICAWTGNIYAGLIYPIAVALMTFVVGSIFLKETRHVRIWDELLHHKRPEQSR